MNELSEKKIEAIRVILEATEEEVTELLRLLGWLETPEEKGDCRDDE